MKRIAIFCDGTWNRHDAKDQTNVVKLARCVRHTDDDGTQQVVFYYPGVGTGRGTNAFARWTDKLLGGAFGWGVMAVIKEAYRALIFAYEPGDEIYIFGFSRGAFTARSLVGLIRSCGIPTQDNLHRVPEAIERYIERGDNTYPDDPDMWSFRAEISTFTATSKKEHEWRRNLGSDAIWLGINYLGLWDTVKAMGIPRFLPFSKRINHRHEFHDDKLSSMVSAARHAISIDEKRSTFPSLGRGNTPVLNAASSGVRVDGRGFADQPFQQLWFAGNHGSVGGGGNKIGLSSITLRWMAIGAQSAGLALSEEDLNRQAWDMDVHEDLSNDFGPALSAGQWVMQNSVRERDGPTDLMELSLAAFDRYVEDNSYRPNTLEHLYDELFKLDATEKTMIRAQMLARDGGRTHSRKSNCDVDQ